jgi:hypothetical protein
MQFFNTPSVIFTLALFLPAALAAPAPAQLYLLESDTVSRPQHLKHVNIVKQQDVCLLICWPDEPRCGDTMVRPA